MTDFTFDQFYSLDLPALLAATFSSVACALLGTFLVLRRQSLMGDAISHAVLPGIVIAFLVSGTNAQLPVFVGAAIAGILTSVLIESIRNLGRLEVGAAMGVVFSVLFALGVLLMEQAAASNIHLDADCLLHGQLETIFWNPTAFSGFASLSTIFKEVPAEVYASVTIALLTVVVILFFFKELTISSFDPALSTALGFDSRIIHYILMAMVAAAVVASFKVVGSILVIAMIICPPATARLLTDKLKTQLFLSAFFAVVSVVAGYFLAAFGPFWLGLDHSVNAAGMMAVTSGVCLAISTLAAPQYGVLAQQRRQKRLQKQIAYEDLLGLLYRAEEWRAKSGSLLERNQIATALGSHKLAVNAIEKAKRNGEIQLERAKLALTEKGRAAAKGLVRTHRLWETYLVSFLGLSPDHVHHTATQLEHFTSAQMARRLAENQKFPGQDPHGKVIPGDDE